MNNTLAGFNKNIENIKSLTPIHDYIVHSSQTQLLDTTNLLRSQIVLITSAFDYYIHEITRIGMLEIFTGTRQPTSAYLNYSLQIQCLNQASNSLDINRLSDWIRQKHSYQSFQMPDKVADAIRCFYSDDLWQKVSTNLGIPKADIKRKLTLIIERRNKIAHEADIDPSYPGVQWPITVHDVEYTSNFVIDIVTAIHSCVI